MLWDSLKPAYYENPALHKEEKEWENKVRIKNKLRRGFEEGKTYIWEVALEVQSWEAQGLGKMNSCLADNSTCEFVKDRKREENTSDDRAPWMKIAYGELGVEEIVGKKHNDRILEYHNSSNSKGSPDEIPWCGAFVCWVMKECGYNSELPDTPSKAVRWQNFGKSIDLNTPPYGSIVSIAWEKDTKWGQGHVGFVVAVEGDDYYILGGNQKGRDKKTEGKVCVSRYKKSKILSLNMPKDYEIKDVDFKYDKINKNKSGQYETLQSTR